MNYKEMIRVPRGLAVLAILVALALLVDFSFRDQQGATVQVQIGDQPSASASHVHAASKQELQAAFGIPLSLLFAIAGVVATFFAAAYGSSLASENSGHLDVAWTKPASRSRYALTLIAVDILGAATAFAIAFGAALIAVAIARALGSLYVDQDAWLNLARFLLLPIAFTGFWQALTASRKAQSGGIVGLSVVACVVFLGLGAAHLPTAFHALVSFVN
ncbi:MAG TPA: hypothetical protein VKR99_03065, partial [Candidatus Eremiobacteraceae bacterium]|nr:hypothetical protein [Candidatus Eremiobacteraceae bacterium]